MTLLPPQGSLTLFTNEKGGIIDDLIVTKTDQGYLYVVSNAGCADKDSANMKVGVCGWRGGDRHGLSVCVCVFFIFRPGWQSSKVQALMWIWSSLTQHWLLFKVNSSCVPLPSSSPPSFGISASPSLLPCVSTPVVLLGPSMSRVLQEGLKEDLSKLTFMTSTLATLFGVPDCRITRCGYTGEDGVEVSLHCSVHLYMATENGHLVS